MKQPNLLANPKRKFSAKQIAAQKRFAAMAKSGKFRKRKKNPVKAGARRSPPKRNPAEKFVIRAQRPVKSGYLYYYLCGDQFVKDAKHADKFGKADGEKHMRAILPQLPRAIASITLVKA